MARLVECVPNFSEGRNRAVIDAISDAIKGVADVKLLDVDPGADTNRTVFRRPPCRTPRSRRPARRTS